MFSDNCKEVTSNVNCVVCLDLFQSNDVFHAFVIQNAHA